MTVWWYGSVTTGLLGAHWPPSTVQTVNCRFKERLSSKIKLENKGEDYPDIHLGAYTHVHTHTQSYSFRYIVLEKLISILKILKQ